MPNAKLKNALIEEAELLLKKIPAPSSIEHISPRSLETIRQASIEFGKEVFPELEGTQLEKFTALKEILSETLEGLATNPLSKYFGQDVSNLKSASVRGILGNKEYETLASEMNATLLRTESNIALASLTADYVFQLDTALSGRDSLSPLIPRSNDASTSSGPIKRNLYEFNPSLKRTVDNALKDADNLAKSQDEFLNECLELSEILFHVNPKKANALKKTFDELGPETFENPFFAIPPLVQGTLWVFGLIFVGNEVQLYVRESNSNYKIREEKKEEAAFESFCAKVSDVIATVQKSASELAKAATDPAVIANINPQEILLSFLPLKSELTNKIQSFDEKYQYNKCISAQVSMLDPLASLPSTHQDIQGLSFDDAIKTLLQIAIALGVSGTTYADFAEKQRAEAKRLREESGLEDDLKRRQLFTNVLTYGAYSALGLGIIWGASKIYLSAKAQSALTSDDDNED